MNLSDVCDALESGAENSDGLKNVYGVTFDGLQLLPPVGLESIGLVAVFDASGQLSQDYLDTAVAFATEQVGFVVEVPAEAHVDLPKLVATAANTGLGVSLLPPLAGTGEAAWDRYESRLVETTELYLGQKSFGEALMPITNYFQYMVGEALGYTPEAVTEDPYTRERFVDGWDSGRMDRIKAALRAAILGYFGGADRFRQLFIDTLGEAVVDRYGGLAEEQRRMSAAGDGA